MEDSQNSAGSAPISITKQLLALVGPSVGKKYAATISKSGQGFWTVSIRFEDATETHQVMTARGGTKGWRDVTGAIGFVQQNCPGATEVFLEIGNWTMCRIANRLSGAMAQPIREKSCSE